MRYSTLQFGIVAVVCLMIAGCAAINTEPEPLRAIITFDYVPTAEAVSGSADVTFAIVGAEFVAPTTHQQGVPLQSGMLLPSAPPPLLFQQLINNMTKDFEEVLTARGFAVKGSYRTLSEMIYPDKEGSDLILTAKVKFSADTSGLRYTDEKAKMILSGCVMTPGALIALAVSTIGARRHQYTTIFYWRRFGNWSINLGVESDWIYTLRTSASWKRG